MIGIVSALKGKASFHGSGILEPSGGKRRFACRLALGPHIRRSSQTAASENHGEFEAKNACICCHRFSRRCGLVAVYSLAKEPRFNPTDDSRLKRGGTSLVALTDYGIPCKKKGSHFCEPRQDCKETVYGSPVRPLWTVFAKLKP